MAYILNRPVAENKKCIVALNVIHGLGVPLILQICDQLGISPQVKWKHLSTSQVDKISRCISQNYLTGTDSRRMVSKNKDRLVSINSFRGFRYMQGLPGRGQRTHGNAQTARKQSRFAMSPGEKRFSKGTKKRREFSPR